MERGPSLHLPLPRSIILAQWCSAVISGDCTPAKAEQSVRGADEPHHVYGLSTLKFAHRLGLEPQPQGELESAAQLHELINEVSQLHRPEIYAILPSPGFVDGLVGPPQVNSSALMAEECVIVAEAGRTVAVIVPKIESFGSQGDQGHHVAWQVLRCNPRPAQIITSIRAVHQELQASLLHHLDHLESLDLPAIVRGDDNEAILIDHPSHWTTRPLPNVTDAQRSVVALALRFMLVTAHALDAGREIHSMSTFAAQDLALSQINRAGTVALLNGLRARS